VILLSGSNRHGLDIANFLDVWIVNADTASFLFSVRPDSPASFSLRVLALPALALLVDRQFAGAPHRSAQFVPAAGITGTTLARRRFGGLLQRRLCVKFSRSGMTAISG
jgi:hypothetical protein